MAATSFFGGAFFGGEFFNTAIEPDTTPVKTGTGGIDPRRIIKPTGLLRVPRKEGRKEIADRVDDSRDIQVEIAGRLAREFTDETVSLDVQPTVVEMSIAEIEFEIGVLLRKKLRNEEDEVLLFLLMVAATV